MFVAAISERDTRAPKNNDKQHAEPGGAHVGRARTGIATRDNAEGSERQTFKQGAHMPRIIVTADGPTELVVLSERINVADFESDHFRAHLVQRLAWAVDDARATEHDHPDQAP